MQQQDEIKNEILELLNLHLSEMDGGKDLIHYLEFGCDFFTAPASTKYHNNFDGGLADHSLSVYKLFKEKVERFNVEFSEKSILICALFHDLCKLDFYYKGKKWKKINDNRDWVQYDTYLCKDNFPVGHGEKSVFILQRFFNLSETEIATIRWHMMAFDASIHFDYPNGLPFREAVNKYPTVTLLATADMESTTLLETIIQEPS